jgi:hypothetical protein
VRVVASTLGGLAEIVVDSESGLLMNAEEQARPAAGARRRAQEPRLERRAARLLELLEKRERG